MGLDMYLEKKVGEEFEEVAYWRKANQIHNWFVKTIQDGKDNDETNCKRFPVSKKVLENLLETVNKVLKNKDLASQLLPTTSGFFYGSIVYDSYYIYDLERTKEQITKVITETDFETEELFYMAWW